MNTGAYLGNYLQFQAGQRFLEPGGFGGLHVSTSKADALAHRSCPRSGPTSPLPAQLLTSTPATFHEMFCSLHEKPAFRQV
jgi:hypothetical protein